jgi:predicted nuclease of predicted toxin-antitoxin system
VKPLDFPLLTDENIAPDVVEGLRARGCDLRTAAEEHLIGRPDVEILGRSTSQGRVVVTHDLGFGRSAIIAGATFL